MQDIKRMNRLLTEKYGSDLLGRPRYRLIICSDKITEKRKFQEILWIHKVPVPKTIIKEQPKYSYVPDGTWILEMFCELSPDHPDIADKISYEPIWVFHDGPPTERILLFVTESAQKGPTKVLSEEEEKGRSKREIFESLGGRAGISDSLAAGEGIGVPSNYNKEN